ncbi:MAG: YkgJ family cysteine cluster protein [Eubacteriales bacterium]|nr:YkgJ family cysteine cluster protein [Eubacteriales bacterium]
MRREVALEEISDGKLYGLNDMVKADCHDCKDCFDCCTGMGDTVILDPLDVHRLSVNLKKMPDKLLEEDLELGVADGNILPHLRMSGKEERCVFLNGEGRCSIHSFRPGICRLFPLGRYYEDNGFRYFLQIHECRKKNRSKVKVKKWIDTPDVKRYEQFVTDWHYYLKDVQEILYQSEDTQLIKNLNLYVINRFYLKPYETARDFYEQFYERMEEARGLLSLSDDSK